MIKGIYLASQNLTSTMKKMSNIANNLANINTTGFKRRSPFTEVLNSAGNVKVRQKIDWTQGDLQQTGNVLDLALDGKGFFAVKTDTGLKFTRSGKFKISSEGDLLDSKGNKVMGVNGEVVFSDNLINQNSEISINKEGEIKVGNNYVDSLLIVSGENLQNFDNSGNDYFSSNDGSYKIADPDEYRVEQGYLEASNVNPIIEMESMISISKNYESAQRTVTFIDQSIKKAVEIGKV